MKFSDLFSFEKFVTPGVIKFFYWIGLVIITIGGLFFVFNIMSNPYMPNSGLVGLLVLILIPVYLLFWRMFCEMIILGFKVFGRLTEIRDALTRVPGQAQPPRSGNPY